MTLIAPSLLSCDFSQIKHECSWIKQTQADWLHLDVMDGVFVPNISFGIPVVKAVRSVSTMWLDTHLMIVKPHKYIDAFREAGSDALSIHIEACKNAKHNLRAINDSGMKAGIAINPDTPAEDIFDLLFQCHHVCLMSVYPGFGGQKFIRASLRKIKKLKQFIITNKLDTLIQIDGGVTLDNAYEIVHAGADVLIAGNTIFNSKHPVETIHLLKQT